MESVPQIPRRAAANSPEMLWGAELNSRLASALIGTSHAVAFADRSGHVVWTNDAFLRWYGRDHLQSPDLHLRDFLCHPQNPETLPRDLEEGFLAGVSFQTETTCYHRGGAAFRVQIDAQPVFGSDGMVVGHCLLNSVISSRRTADESLEEAGQIARVGAWQIAVATLEVTWSAQMYRMFEVAADYHPTLKSLVGFFTGESRPIITAAVRRAIGSAVPFDLELPVVTARNRPCWMRVIGHAETSGDLVTRVYGSLQDITDRRNLEAERQRLQKQITKAQRMESVGRLAGGIAHDFNNMLTVILGHTEMLLLNSLLSPEQQLHLNSVLDAGRRAARLTQQLLAFARRQDATPQRVNLNLSVQRMLDLMRNSFGRSVDVEWIPAADAGELSIDPVQLDQILANLCMNARDAIVGNGRIVVSTQTEILRTTRILNSSSLYPGDYLVLTVSDTGCGISETALTHLFEPFSTAKLPRAGEGPGLGLATVHGIVCQNGGAIDIESDPDVGTTIRVYLPRHNPAAPDVGESAAHSAQNPRAVLLAARDRVVRSHGKRLLKKLGHPAFTAATVREVLQMMQSHGEHIDVIVAESELQGGSDSELRLRVRSLRPDMQFVRLQPGSGNVTAEDTHPDSDQHDTDPVLVRPFDLSSLRSVLSQSAERSLT